jgi:RNA polymerase sigma factor (sigma-70 family)
MEDHQRLLDGLRRGDSLIIKEIYAQFAPQICQLVEKNSGSADDAGDVFQEGIMACFDLSNRPGFQLSVPFGALFYKLCHNKWMDKLRAKKRQPEVSFVDDVRYEGVAEDVFLMAEAAEQQRALHEKLDATFLMLSELCRQLLGLAKKGMPAATIAANLGMAEMGTYYRRKNACLERWKNLMQ